MFHKLLGSCQLKSDPVLLQSRGYFSLEPLETRYLLNADLGSLPSAISQADWVSQPDLLIAAQIELQPTQIESEQIESEQAFSTSLGTIEHDDLEEELSENDLNQQVSNSAVPDNSSDTEDPPKSEDADSEATTDSGEVLSDRAFHGVSVSLANSYHGEAEPEMSISLLQQGETQTSLFYRSRQNQNQWLQFGLLNSLNDKPFERSKQNNSTGSREIIRYVNDLPGEIQQDSDFRDSRNRSEKALLGLSPISQLAVHDSRLSQSSLKSITTNSTARKFFDANGNETTQSPKLISSSNSGAGMLERRSSFALIAPPELNSDPIVNDALAPQTEMLASSLENDAVEEGASPVLMQMTRSNLILKQLNNQGSHSPSLFWNRPQTPSISFDPIAEGALTLLAANSQSGSAKLDSGFELTQSQWQAPASNRYVAASLATSIVISIVVETRGLSMTRKNQQNKQN